MPVRRECTKLKKIQFAGTVFSGRGEGEKFTKLEWVQRQMAEKLGFTPYVGTLNLHLTEDSAKQKKKLTKKEASGIITSTGYCDGLLFKARINNIECGIVIPQVENYPDDELEIVADLNLRRQLGLRDGDRVNVTISV